MDPERQKAEARTSPREMREEASGSALIARDGRALFVSAGLAASGQVVALAAGFACTVVTVRLLTTAAYGRFALFFMVLEIVSHLLQWPDQGLVRFGREELAAEGRLARVFWARAALFAVCAGLVAALLFAFRAPLNAYLNLSPSAHGLLLAYVTLNGAVLAASSVFQTVTEFRAYALASAAVKLLNLAGIVIVFLVLRGAASPAGVLGVHVASFAVVTVVCAGLLPWRLLRPVRTDLAALRRLAGYSWPFVFAGLAALVVNWVDFVVIRHVRSEAEVGLYAVAYQAVIVLITLQVAVVSAVLPLLVSLILERRTEALHWCLDEALPQAAWGIGLCAVLLAGAAEAIPLLFGARYAPSVVPCQVLMAGVAAFQFSGLQAALAKAADRPRAVMVVGALLAGLNALFDLALVPGYGMRGAALATSAAYALTGLLYFPILNQIPILRRPRSWRAYLSVGGILAPCAMAVGALTMARAPARLAWAAGVLIVWGCAGRALRVFRASTLRRLDAVRMPAIVRRALGAVYAALGAADASEGDRA